MEGPCSGFFLVAAVQRPRRWDLPGDRDRNQDSEAKGKANILGL